MPAKAGTHVSSLRRDRDLRGSPPSRGGRHGETKGQTFAGRYYSRDIVASCGDVMVRGDMQPWRAAVAAAALLAGCTQTSQVDENLSTASLSQTKNAVAIMRVGAASPSCINVAVLLGVREGDGFRRHQGLTVMNVRSITEPAVAEVELDPGEYHVVAYRCQSKQGVKQVDDNAGNTQLYRASYASFTL